MKNIKRLVKQYLVGPKIGDIYQEYYYTHITVSPWQTADHLKGLVKVLDMKSGWIRYQSISDEEIYERKISTFLNNYVFYDKGEVENG